LTRGEAFAVGSEDVLDPVERFALAVTLPDGFLLDATPNIIGVLAGERDWVERVECAGVVFELAIRHVLVPLMRVQCRDLDPYWNRAPRAPSQS